MSENSYDRFSFNKSHRTAKLKLFGEKNHCHGISTLVLNDVIM